MAMKKSISRTVAHIDVAATVLFAFTKTFSTATPVLDSYLEAGVRCTPNDGFLIHPRPHDFPLPHHRETRGWGHGGGVQGRGHKPAPLRRAQVSAGRGGAGCADSRTIPAGSPGRVGVESPEHLHRLRDWRRERPG